MAFDILRKQWMRQIEQAGYLHLKYKTTKSWPRRFF
jgi:hypothetical protein